MNYKIIHSFYSIITQLLQACSMSPAGHFHQIEVDDIHHNSEKKSMIVPNQNELDAS